MTRAEMQGVRSLRDRKGREEFGLFAIEGAKVVGELLAAGVEPAEIYATADWNAPAGVAGRVKRVTALEMERISHFPTPSPVLMVLPIEERRLEAGELRSGLTLALDGVQDAGNVGTLIRVADWFGFQRVVLSRDCADRYSPKVVHATMGSFARVRVYAADLAEELANAGVPVIGCELSGEDVQAVAGVENAVVVIGSEGRGLSERVKKCVTKCVTIPRFGGAESLNAAVAGGIVCAALRRRGSASR